MAIREDNKRKQWDGHIKPFCEQNGSIGSEGEEGRNFAPSKNY